MRNDGTPPATLASGLIASATSPCSAAVCGNLSGRPPAPSAVSSRSSRTGGRDSREGGAPQQTLRRQEGELRGVGLRLCEVLRRDRLRVEDREQFGVGQRPGRGDARGRGEAVGGRVSRVARGNGVRRRAELGGDRIGDGQSRLAQEIDVQRRRMVDGGDRPLRAGEHIGGETVEGGVLGAKSVQRRMGELRRGGVAARREAIDAQLQPERLWRSLARRGQVAAHVLVAAGIEQGIGLHAREIRVVVEAQRGGDGAGVLDRAALQQLFDADRDQGALGRAGRRLRRRQENAARQAAREGIGADEGDAAEQVLDRLARGIDPHRGTEPALRLVQHADRRSVDRAAEIALHDRGSRRTAEDTGLVFDRRGVGGRGLVVGRRRRGCRQRVWPAERRRCASRGRRPILGGGAHDQRQDGRRRRG